MKLKSLVPLGLIVSAVACTTAQAQNTVTFQGAYVAVSCTASFNGGGASGTLNMGGVMEGNFPTVNSFTGEKDFSIGLSGCGALPTGTRAKAYFYSTAQSTPSNRLDLDSANSTGSGWQYQITDPGGSTMQIGTAASPIPIYTGPNYGVDVSAGAGTLQYTARFFRSDINLVPGNGQAQVSYLIFFQ